MRRILFKTHTIILTLGMGILILASFSNSMANILLSNDFVKAEISTQVPSLGQITLIHNFLDGTEFRQDGQIEKLLFLNAKDFSQKSFKILSQNTSEASLQINYSLATNPSILALNLTIHYQIENDQLKIHYEFHPLITFRLKHYIEFDNIFGTADYITPFNQFDTDQTIQSDSSAKKYYQTLNQIYAVHLNHNLLNFMTANPYESLVEANKTSDGFLKFSYVILPAYEPWKAFEPKGPKIASLLSDSTKFHFDIRLFLTKSEKDNKIFAYFSPFPNTYDQVISMIFDEVPFYRWLIPPSHNHPEDISGQNYLIKMLNDHPKMKMCWVVIPDPITAPDGLENPDYPKGKWWLAHGVHRIATYAPEEYKRWMRHLEEDSVILGYENRVHLGDHGYHHTPEGKYGRNWEFQTFDSLRDERTMDMVNLDFQMIGLTHKSLKFIRFPGFKFTRSIIDALAHHNFTSFDFDLAWEINRLPLFQYYTGSKKLWAISANWEGDTPLTYEHMKYYLSKGKWVHTAGHPIFWFNYGDEKAYQIRSKIFSQAERDFPNLGYVYFDDYADIANELANISNFSFGVSDGEISVSFAGKLTKNETLIIQVISPDSLLGPITIDDEPITNFRTENKKLLVSLPVLGNGNHLLKILYKVPQYLIMNTLPLKIFPNPVRGGEQVRILHIPENCDVYILNENGILVRNLTEGKKRNELSWDLANKVGVPVPSGVYLIALKNVKTGKVFFRKIAVVR